MIRIFVLGPLIAGPSLSRPLRLVTLQTAALQRPFDVKIGSRAPPTAMGS